MILWRSGEFSGDASGPESWEDLGVWGVVGFGRLSWGLLGVGGRSLFGKVWGKLWRMHGKWLEDVWGCFVECFGHVSGIKISKRKNTWTKPMHRFQVAQPLGTERPWGGSGGAP